MNVDLEGNDRYEGAPALWADSSTLPVVFGAGVGALGGLGVLVDAAGDDIYETAPSPGGSLPPSIVAQGVGLGGVGALFDLGGNDRYTARFPDGGVGTAFLYAQGMGSSCYVPTGGPPLVASAGCGIGLLADLEDGDDRYSLDGGTVIGPAWVWDPDAPLEIATRYIDGQGAGLIGVGTLIDRGARTSSAWKPEPSLG